MALTAETCNKLKLKRLCTTRWSSRVDAVRATKNRYTDILKVLTRICLETRDSKENADAMGLKKRIENYEFIVFIIMWEGILISINRASLKLQATQMDMSLALRLLNMASSDLKELRDSWKSINKTAASLAAEWGVPTTFSKKGGKS